MLSQVKFNQSPITFSAQTKRETAHTQSFGNLKPLQKDTVEFTSKYTDLAKQMGRVKKGIKPVKITPARDPIVVSAGLKWDAGIHSSEVRLGVKETGVLGTNTEIVRKPLILGEL